MCIQRQCQGVRPKTAGRKVRASSVPIQRSSAEPLGRERIQESADAAQPQGQQEGGEAKGLEQEIAEIGTEEANPVVHGI